MKYLIIFLYIIIISTIGTFLNGWLGIEIKPWDHRIVFSVFTFLKGGLFVILIYEMNIMKRIST